MTAKKKHLALLGATGSVGTSAARVLRELRDSIDVTVVSARCNAEKLAALANEFHAHAAVIADPAALDRLKSCLAPGIRAYAGTRALCELVAEDDVDQVLCAIVGTSALRPCEAALRAGKTLALATKEVLVAAGGFIMRLAAENHTRILPVDSEHSAVFQCLENGQRASLEKVILTASGGPFRNFTKEELERATPEQALKHPVWSMGKKVTLDSASMMNKALEMIEAKHLFSLAPEEIDVLIHPQSVVHSLVEWRDGSVQALLGVPDMRFPIQYALTRPERLDTALPRLDLASAGPLTFERPDESRFPALALAREAMRRGGTIPAVMNAANEIAVRRFLAGEIRFPSIWDIVGKVMAAAPDIVPDGFEVLEDVETWARARAENEVV